jgi:hypothetical protein
MGAGDPDRFAASIGLMTAYVGIAALRHPGQVEKV